MKVFLIGMPGCGKTSLGKIAAQNLKIEFTDTDSEIEKRAGTDISTIFEQKGEDFFRTLETEVLKDEIKKSGNRIISTGGGIVVREENIEILQNSGAEVIFIDRHPELIAKGTDNSKRPLIKDNTEAVFKLYDQRYKKYNRACSSRIINDSDIKNAVSALIERIRRAKL